MPEEIYPVTFDIPSSIRVTWESWRGIGLPRLVNSMRYKIPHFQPQEINQHRCVVVGGGPSVAVELQHLKELSRDSTVCSVNGAHNWLISQGITPDIHVFFENDIENIEDSLGGQPNKDTTYYICSHCHENMFKQLEGHKAILWHAYAKPEDYRNAVNMLFPGEVLIGGGFITLYRTIALGRALGHRTFDLFGVDSSFEDSSHVDGYATADQEKELPIWARNDVTGELRCFKTNVTLAQQAQNFIKLCELYPDISITVHGDGLLQYIHKTKYPEQYNERGVK